jgi:hypothetical protein
MDYDDDDVFGSFFASVRFGRLEFLENWCFWERFVRISSVWA